jgi:hypothetical protein
MLMEHFKIVNNTLLQTAEGSDSHLHYPAYHTHMGHHCGAVIASTSALISSNKRWAPNAVALQRGEATQVGDGAICHTVSPTQVKELQCGKAT